MAAWVPLKEFLRGLTNEIAETNVEMQTTQRMAWAESVAYYKQLAEQASADELDKIRFNVLKDSHSENQLVIKEVKLSFVLKKRGFFARMGSRLANPFSGPVSRYQLLPGYSSYQPDNVEIIFTQQENGKWEAKSPQLPPSDETSVARL